MTPLALMDIQWLSSGLAQAHLDTENAVTCAISMNENVIKLPEDITIMSVDD